MPATSLSRSPPMPSLSLLVTLTLLTAAHSESAATYANCDRTFSCGHITNVTFPFTGADRPSYCGLPDFALSCRDNAITELTQNSIAYRVLRLDQTQKTLVLSRSDLYTNTCPSRFHNTTLNSTLFFYSAAQNEALSLFYGCNTSGISVRPYNLFSCNSSGLNFTYSYHVIGPIPSNPVLRMISCRMSISVPLLRDAANQLTESRLSLGEALMQGFTVNYSVPHERLCTECNRMEGQCGFDPLMGLPVCICGDKACPFALSLPPEASSPPDAPSQGMPPAPSPGGNRSSSYPVLSPASAPSAAPTPKSLSRVWIIIGVILGITCVVIFAIVIVCYLRRRSWSSRPKQESNKVIETFLHQHGSLAPKRFKYSEIKKITKSFSDKLGQGGYGSVYKGILPDGCLVAVKVLTEINSNGEEFINEVASISRTSHVNIVNLLGFCYDRNKRALIYEFMPNMSLDKFISNSGADCSLDLNKLYNIAVGVAKGLEYLHTGCSTRIVHFDIKPQNILLDEDFCPKISDFGLAKLCKRKQSALSMVGTRGTIGYIAPEVFSRNFGRVSHKSDVYSYGMMVLEMVGANKIVESEENQSSESYFPDKIYEVVTRDITGNLGDVMVEEEEQETVRKMILVGFWCIQTIPSERPSMSKVVEMLEVSLQSIHIPPKPVLITPTLPDQEFSPSLSAYTDTESSAEVIANG